MTMHKILIVEDDKFLLNVYRLKLTKEGFEVRLAKNGDEALETLKDFKPDVILLDLVMPVRDGFSVLEELKKDPTLSKIPVIITTNLGQKEDIDRGLKLGARDYIIKSETAMEKIMEKIRNTLK